MNFDEAIEAHAEWKLRLRVHLEDPEQSGLTAADFEPDDRCDLGNWIRAEYASWAHHPSFRTLEQTHREFHLAAASVIRKAEAGERMEAEAILSGEYARRSAAVISAIVEFRRRAARPRSDV